MEVYRCDPSTGEVFETRQVANDKEKDQAIADGWFETPRWQRNPRPHGLTNDNPYERVVVTPYAALPATLHKVGGLTKTVATAAEREKALKAGWSEQPVGTVLVHPDLGETIVYTADAIALARPQGWTVKPDAKA